MFKKFLLFLMFLIIILTSVAALSLFDEAMIEAAYITLNGEETVLVEVYSEYTDPGCTAEYGSPIWGFDPLEYTADGTVDTSVIGTYSIKYATVNDGESASVTRTVNVVDTTMPTITAPQEINAYIGTTVFSVNYSAWDNLDGDLTASVIKQDNADSVTLTVTDSQGNTAQHTVRVNFVADITPPQLILAGFDKTVVKLGTVYAEPGYTATDNCDGNITSRVQVSGSVNTAVEGEYQLVYTVSDAAGNSSSVSRIVRVYSPAQISGVTDPSGSVIYLTFDDGPGKYTDKLLSILESYGVKATFFVTNQFPDYQHLIGKAYSLGHAIGVHTYSHQWSIYSSPEAYFADFNQMNEIIKAQTGRYSNIFRFPGGTSNIVSRQYCPGIMSYLSVEMPKSGYISYDWNVDCADTVYKRPAQIASQVKRNLKKGQSNIVLLHDIKGYTVNAVPEIIRYGIAEGYTFAVITENTPPYNLTVAN